MEGKFFKPEGERGMTQTVVDFLRDIEIAGFDNEQEALLKSLVTENISGQIKIELENSPFTLIATKGMEPDDIVHAINRSLQEMFDLMTPQETDDNKLPTISFTPDVLH